MTPCAAAAAAAAACWALRVICSFAAFLAALRTAGEKCVVLVVRRCSDSSCGGGGTDTVTGDIDTFRVLDGGSPSVALVAVATDSLLSFSAGRDTSAGADELSDAAVAVDAVCCCCCCCCSWGCCCWGGVGADLRDDADADKDAFRVGRVRLLLRDAFRRAARPACALPATAASLCASTTSGLANIRAAAALDAEAAAEAAAPPDGALVVSGDAALGVETAEAAADALWEALPDCVSARSCVLSVDDTAGGMTGTNGADSLGHGGWCGCAVCSGRAARPSPPSVIALSVRSCVRACFLPSFLSRRSRALPKYFCRRAQRKRTTAHTAQNNSAGPGACFAPPTNDRAQPASKKQPATAFCKNQKRLTSQLQRVFSENAVCAADFLCDF